MMTLGELKESIEWALSHPSVSPHLPVYIRILSRTQRNENGSYKTIEVPLDSGVTAFIDRASMIVESSEIVTNAAVIKFSDFIDR